MRDRANARLSAIPRPEQRTRAPLRVLFCYPLNKGLRGIEWVILGQDTAESCAFPSYFALPLGFESTMNVGWHEQRSEGGGCGVHIRSPVFDRNRQCAAFSVIRKRV